MVSIPLHDRPCYGVVLCLFGLPAGMHAEAAWSTVGVADLSVGNVGSPSAKHAWPGTIQQIPLPISAHKNLLVAPDTTFARFLTKVFLNHRYVTVMHVLYRPLACVN